jgi:hypothetical protein
MSLKRAKVRVTQEWLEAEEDDLPVHARSPRITGADPKIPRAATTKSRIQTTAHLPPPPLKPEPVMREPGTTEPPKEKHSQATSWEHLNKLNRLPSLRAPDSRPKVKAAGKGR